MAPTAILPGGQYFTVDDGKMGRVAETYGKSIGLSEFKLTTPLRQGTAVLLHFDMFHRGTKRLEEDSGHPHRPMIKFQFFRTSEPTAPSWDCPGGQLVEETPFAFTGAPQYKQAIWEEIYRWMGGQEQTAKHVGKEEEDLVDVLALAAAMQDDAVDAEQLRVGSGYSLGQAASKGNAEALQALLTAIDSPEQSERRAAMWGLSCSGGSAMGALMERVALTPPDTEKNLERLADLILALGEAAQAPVSNVVEVIGGVMSTVHATIDVSDEVTLEQTKSEWRRSTAFCSPEFRQMYGRKEWEALASAAQSLMCVAQTAAAAHDIEGCVDVLALASKYSAVDINLGPTTRHNACMSMLALTPPGLLPPDAAAQLEGVFAAAAEDDDRYVMSVGVEGLRRLNLPSAEEMASDPSAMSKASLLNELAFMRFCPINSPTSPF
jgi:hypothetical protein